MHLFILTDTQWAFPKLIVIQKVIDIIEAGANTPQLLFYVVGTHLPAGFVQLYTNNAQVSILNQQEAVPLIKELTSPILLHFGNELKGMNACPQYFIPLTHPGLSKDKRFLKRIQEKRAFANYLKKSAGVFCLNDWAMHSLQSFYKEYSGLFQPAFLSLASLPIFEWQDLAETKTAISDGNNFFLAFIPVDRFVHTLKEFSVFKKWQQTTMSIVFVFDTNKELEEAAALLRNYKYKEAVVLKNSSDLSLNWIAATYAVLFDGVDFDKTSIMEWAIQYEIPLMFNHNNTQPTSWLKAGSVFSFSEKSELAGHLKLYYKDEVYRQARARMGKEWLTLLSSERLAKGLPNLPTDLKG